MAGFKVLIIDDLEMMRRIVARWIRAHGIYVEEMLEANNGAEALEALDRTSVDMIFCDIKMPVMDGLEFLKLVRCRPGCANTPIVMISAVAHPSIVLDAVSSGANGFLCKPFTVEEFKAHVGPLLAPWIQAKASAMMHSNARRSRTMRSSQTSTPLVSLDLAPA